MSGDPHVEVQACETAAQLPEGTEVESQSGDAGSRTPVFQMVQLMLQQFPFR